MHLVAPVQVALALILCLCEQKPVSCWNLLTDLHAENVVQWRNAALLCIPAGLYVVQNNLLFVAVQNLDSTKYQITYQLKILITAMFAVLLLGQKLNARKWLSLIFLVIGVVLVQLNVSGTPPATGTAATSEAAAAAAAAAGNREHIGLLAVVAASCTSGFAGVYFEKILKGTATSLWMRNVQLGTISIIVGLVGVHTKDGAAVRSGGFFQGYTPTVWAVILLQSFGGLMVAAVIKYATGAWPPGRHPCAASHPVGAESFEHSLCCQWPHTPPTSRALRNPP